MNHLQEAKDKLHYAENYSMTTSAVELSQAHALIAIAESIERIVEGQEMPRIIIELPEKK